MDRTIFLGNTEPAGLVRANGELIDPGGNLRLDKLYHLFSDT